MGCVEPDSWFDGRSEKIFSLYISVGPPVTASFHGSLRGTTLDISPMSAGAIKAFRSLNLRGEILKVSCLLFFAMRLSPVVFER
jgi:hypothetical protein